MTLIDTLAAFLYYTIMIPDDLLSRIISDSPLDSALSSSPLDPSNPRADADFRFNALTPLAISTLARASANADPKIAVAAATEILKHSPATRDNLPSASLSPMLAATLLAPMASILQSMLGPSILKTEATDITPTATPTATAIASTDKEPTDE